MGKGTSGVFSRADIYLIREMAERGASAATIKRARYPEVGTETIRRIIRRDTYSEIGVGSAERPMMSNRLRGEDRDAGDFAPAYQPVVRSTPEEIASSLRILSEVAPAFRAAEGLPPLADQKKPDPIFEAYMARGKSIGGMAPAHQASDPFDLPDDGGEDESAEAILARRAQALPPHAADPAGDALLGEMLRGDGTS